MEHYEQSEYNVNENDDHSSTHQSLDEDIKGRTCDNGAKQRRCVKMGEIIYSSTISLVYILTTLSVYAYEGIDVAIVYVPEVYLHANMPQIEGKIVLLKLKGDFVVIMCSVNKEYTPHVIYERKSKVYI